MTNVWQVTFKDEDGELMTAPQIVECHHPWNAPRVAEKAAGGKLNGVVSVTVEKVSDGDSK